MIATPEAKAIAWRAEPILRRLEAHHPLGEARAVALAALGGEVTRHSAGDQVIAEGAGGRPAFVTAGWAAAQKDLGRGERQILWIILPGDLIGLEAGRGPPGWSVSALTNLTTLPAGPLVEAAVGGCAPLARALAMHVRQEHRLMLDQVVMLGRYPSPRRIAHILLQLRDRCLAAGLGTPTRFPLPVTQEVIADLVGMSAIHVNRTLKGIRSDGIIELKAGHVQVLDPVRLEAIARGEEGA